MSKLTKKEVTEQCRQVFRENPSIFRGDNIAKREYFNNYTDSLCKDGLITEHQYNNWSNPF